MVVQLHIIARGDDCSKLRVKDLKPHSMYDFALKLSIKWSKSIRDERMCPDQLLIGSFDHDLCVLLALALFLEEWINQGSASAGKEAAFLFTSDSNPKKGPAKVNRNYRTALKTIFAMAEFVVVAAKLGGLLGLHSMRKFGASFARSLGSSPDDVDTISQLVKAE